MKLDRNINVGGKGKYALIKLRDLDMRQPEVHRALEVLANEGALDWGDAPETEFFVMRLKDKYAYRGLMGYYNAITLEEPFDAEYALELLNLAQRAGPNHPHCKLPD